MNFLKPLTFLFFFLSAAACFAQEPDAEEEDWSIYDDLEYADEGTKRFCTSKIIGLTPAKLISIGYDFQGPHSLTGGAYLLDDAFYPEATREVSYSHGMRVFANVPLISRNNIIIQGGVNHWDQQYVFEKPSFQNEEALNHGLFDALEEGGLRTTGINTTVFKPLNETAFLLFQASYDVNGNYTWDRFQSPKYGTFSAAALWGKKPNDKKQWAFGVSRTYRAGELNYVPIFLFNWTSASGKWGTELLLPARGHVRYTFNTRSILQAGFELEGNSYRLNNGGYFDFLQGNEVHVRRSELRFRFVYERSLYNFIWLSFQGGYRVNYLFEVDEFGDRDDFFRGFFGDQPYFMENTLTNPLYFNISINLVSP